MPPDPVNTEKAPWPKPLWICSNDRDCGNWAEQELGEQCEVCNEGTIQEVPVIPASSVASLEAENEQLRQALTDIAGWERWQADSGPTWREIACSALHPEPTEEEPDA